MENKTLFGFLFSVWCYVYDWHCSLDVFLKFLCQMATINGFAGAAKPNYTEHNNISFILLTPDLNACVEYARCYVWDATAAE